MTTTTDRTRPKRGHAALGGRWFTAGLAVSGTLGIAGYLEVQQLAEAATADLSTPAESVPSNTVAPTTAPAPPPAPKVRIVVVHRNTATPATPGATSGRSSGTVRSQAAPAPAPRATQAQPRTRTPAPSKPKVQATTKGSQG